MSIETMMTLGVAGLIFVSALLILGILTLVTRLSLLILRPTARGTASMVRRHAPTAVATFTAWSDRLDTYIDEHAGPTTRAALVRSADRLGSNYRERLVPLVRDRMIPTVRDRVAPAVRDWFVGDDMEPAMAPARHRQRRA